MRRLANLDDIDSALSLELSHKLHGSVDTSKEGRWPHCTGDDCISAVIGQKEKSVAELDARHVFAEVNRPVHTPISLSAEQLGIETRPAVLIKPLPNVVSA